VKDVVDELRDAGEAIGVVTISSFRPFPAAALREALEGAKRVVVIEKSLAVGIGRHRLQQCAHGPARRRRSVYTVIAGLGGRPITTQVAARAVPESHAGRARAT
jgi:pyruvate ferredoxin oxidoreductase alpha subunit